MTKFEGHLAWMREIQLARYHVETIHNRPYRLDYDNPETVSIHTLIAHLEQFVYEDLPHSMRSADRLAFENNCAEVANLATMLLTRSGEV